MLLSKKALCNIHHSFKTINNNDLISSLNAIGIEVENIIKLKPVQGLIVAKIIDVQKVENTDKLNLCTIQTIDNTYNVVCGANNVRKNMYVVYAPIGTKFSDDFIIEKKVIRGVESFGMLCGYAEINPLFKTLLSEQENKSIIDLDLNNLDENKNLSVNIYDYLDLDDDIFDLTLPSNRNDLNGILNIVNELNYQLNYNFCFSKPHKILNKISENIRIENNDILKQYCFIKITLNNTINKTPWNIKKTLINSNIKTFDNIVDYVNYVSLMMPQPIHIYDLDKLNNSLNFKILTHDREFITINNQKIIAKKNSLVSVDKNDEIAALIGVIGADKYKVDENTKNILVELVNIDHIYMYKLIKELKTNTMAANIFSKPLSSYFIPYAINYLKLLLKDKYEKFEIISSNFNNNKYKKIPYDYHEIINLLGINLSKSEVETILLKTNMQVPIFSNNIVVPSYRLDIENTNDIVEEILKAIDINKLKSVPINNIKDFSVQNYEYKKLMLVSQILINLGFYNTKTYNLVHKSMNEKFNLFGLEPYCLQNPISHDKEYFRTSLIGSLINVFELNVNKKEPNINLFEYQHLYNKKDNTSFNCLTLLISKPIHKFIASNEYTNELSIYINFVLEQLFSYFNQSYILKDVDINIFNTFKKSIVVDNEIIGYVGKIDQKYYSHIKYNNDLFAIEINIDKLTLKDKKFKFSKLSNFNNVYRELTFINKNNTNIIDYINKLKTINLILDINIINIFVDENKTKSYTISITIDNKDNLNIDQINAIFSQCITLLNEFNLILKQQ